MYIICEGDQTIVELKKGREIVRDIFKNGCLTGIIINDELKVIENHSFYNNKIKHVDLKNVKLVGNYAFSKNEITGTLIIPESMKYIGKCAFSDNFIKEVIICNPNTIIEKDAFLNNPNIKIRKNSKVKSLNLSMFNNRRRCS